MPELFNPVTASLDLRESKNVLDGLSFEAKAGDADVEANHYVCTAGCSQHIVYDSEALLKFCPVCTASVASEEEDQAIADEIADDAELDAEEQDDEEDADDEDLDADSDPDLDEDDDGEDDEEDDEDDSAEAGEDCGDDCPGCPQCESDLDDDEDDGEDDEDETSESSSVVDTRPLVIAAATKAEAIAIFKRERRQSATAGADGAGAETVDVNYMVCSSSDCGAHVLAEQDGVTDCPSCKSSLIEPAAAAPAATPEATTAAPAVVAASGSGIVRVIAEAGDDEEDDEDDEEDDDLSVVDEDEDDEDEEDDEAAEASASSAPVNAKTRKIKVKTTIATASAEVPGAAAPAAIDGQPAAPVAAAAPATDGAAAPAAAVIDEATEGQAAPAAVIADDAGTAAPAVEAAPAVVITPPVVDTEAVVVNMLDTLPQDATAAKLDVTLASAINGQPQWTAFYEGNPVATARVADAGKNADMFDKANFGHAVIAGAKHVGVKAILTEMGFKPVTCTAHIPKIINEKVAEQVATARATVDQERGEFTERFMAAMASAAIGINRGFFTDLQNPVKKALWNAMASAGIKNPEVLIDQAFRESGDEYHKTLFAKANDIISKPLEVQESLAKAILGTSYMGVAQASAMAPALEDRLANMGTVTAGAEPASAAPAPVAAAPAGNSQITAVVAGLGRRHR